MSECHCLKTRTDLRWTHLCGDQSCPRVQAAQRSLVEMWRRVLRGSAWRRLKARLLGGETFKLPDLRDRPRDR